MKKRFILSLAALLVMSSVLCSCLSDTTPKTVYYNGANLIKTKSTEHIDQANNEKNLSFDFPAKAENESESSSSLNSESFVVPSLVTEEGNVPLAAAESTGNEIIDKNPEDNAVNIENSTSAFDETFDNPDDYIKRNPEDGALLLPKEHEELAAQSLFVGDSICRGFYAYGVAESESVFAAGSIGARNLLDSMVYYYGKEQDYLTVLKSKNPKYLFLSMGMNDLNMSESDEFCENYKKIINTSLENSEAEIYVCAITPIRVDFTPLERITEFNDKLKDTVTAYSQRVHFINFTAPLKDSGGQMLEQFDSGDGIHLAPEAYYIAMHEIYKRINE